eukprot:EG_transcript_15999
MAQTLTQLPCEVLQHISDFLQSPVLAGVCTWTHEVLHRRHIVCGLCPASLAQDCEVGSWGEMTRSLVVCSPQNGVPKRQPAAGLPPCVAGPRLARHLELLPQAPNLQAITISLPACSLGDAGSKLLSRLPPPPRCGALRAVSLDLRVNDVGNSGAAALATLRFLPQLRSLTLLLGANMIGDVGARALGELRECATLHRLTISVPSNRIGTTGAKALASLKDSPALKTLDLNLRGQWPDIGSDGRCALEELRRGPATRHMTVML